MNFENKQLYIAEKWHYQQRIVEKNSRRSLMKIEGFRTLQEADAKEMSQLKLYNQLINDSFFNFLSGKDLLQKEYSNPIFNEN